MSTITTIQESDLITNSRADINNNFSALNTDKIETSTLDTDTSLTANSDSKIATQKAVKAYVDSGGALNASETNRGLVQEATDAQVTAGTATGSSSAKLFVTPAKLVTYRNAWTYYSLMKSGATTKDLSNNTATTLAHGLGVVPRYIKFTISFTGSTTQSFCCATYISSLAGFYSANEYAGAIIAVGSVTTGANEGMRIYTDVSSDQGNLGQMGTIDATNITINWTEFGTATGTAYILWEAFA
jgi:hypothetical protein